MVVKKIKKWEFPPILQSFIRSKIENLNSLFLPHQVYFLPPTEQRVIDIQKKLAKRGKKQKLLLAL